MAGELKAGAAASASARLADFVVRTPWEQVPPAVQHEASAMTGALIPVTGRV